MKEVYDRCGPFKIPDLCYEIYGVDVVSKCPFKLLTGVIYHGEWKSDLSTRFGKGKQVWIDGSLYEG